MQPINYAAVVVVAAAAAAAATTTDILAMSPLETFGFGPGRSESQHPWRPLAINAGTLFDAAEPRCGHTLRQF